VELKQKHKIKGYGWKRSLPSFNDKMFAPSKYMLATLPSSVDLRGQCPPVYDQGNLGSCTANGIGALLEFVEMKEGKPAYTPSRLFIYYNERVMEGTVSQDAGAEIKDGMAVVANLGAPEPEGVWWWYNISKFAVKPSKKVYAAALNHRFTSYSRVNNSSLTAMQSCLAAGYPIVGGFTVYESFESQTVANTGVVPMPKASEQILGGHAVLVVGYDDASQRFIVRNSWGTSWGMAGYFTIPYAYFTNIQLADDFWTCNIAT
jgi:C1A family cysteine protease